MSTGTNIDPIRAEIMRLEGLQVFDQAGWERVLADLRAQGRECGLVDAERRMRSAMGRQDVPVCTDEDIYTPFLNCGWKSTEDGCCSHPNNATPECHQFCCPISQNIIPLFRGKSPIETYREQQGVAVETEE